MNGISPETYAELRKFIREQGPTHAEPDEDDYGGPSDGDADNAPGAALVIDMKPGGEKPGDAPKVCPTCGHPM